jgi:hypothetical protein
MGSDDGVQHSELLSFWTLSIVQYSNKLENTTFRKLDLFPSSGQGEGKLHLVSWVSSKELTSITGQTKQASSSLLLSPIGTHDHIFVLIYNPYGIRRWASSSVFPMLLACASCSISDCLWSAFFTSKRHKPSHHVKVAVHGEGDNLSQE